MEKKKLIIIGLAVSLILVLLFGGITLGNSTKKPNGTPNTEGTNVSEQQNNIESSTETDIATDDTNTQESENMLPSTETEAGVTDENSENVTSSENDTPASEKEEVSNKPANNETNTEKEESSNDIPSVPETPSTPTPETPNTQTPPSEPSIPQGPSSSEIANAQAIYSGNTIGDGLDSYRQGLHAWTIDGQYQLYTPATFNGYYGYFYLASDKMSANSSAFSAAFRDNYLTNENKMKLSYGHGISVYNHSYEIEGVYYNYMFMAYYDFDDNDNEIYGCYYEDGEEYFDESLDAWVTPSTMYCKDNNGKWYYIDKSGNKIYI